MSREGDEPSARPLGTTRVLDPRLKPGASTAFRSLLFDDSGINPDIDKQDVPEFFSDLNLDQVVASITAGRDEYNLKPFFYTPLKSVAAINYRYDIFRDLDSEVLLGVSGGGEGSHFGGPAGTTPPMFGGGDRTPGT